MLIDLELLKGKGYDHSSIVFHLAKSIGCESYLELGIYIGNNINSISSVVPLCVGVDIVPVSIKGEFFLGTTDEFFKQNTKTFDMIFIDADHKFESAKSDFNNSLQILNKGGIILIHDTDPISKEYTLPGYCGDGYRLMDLMDGYDELNFIVLPILETGISIINRKCDRRSLSYE